MLVNLLKSDCVGVNLCQEFLIHNLNENEQTTKTTVARLV